VGDEATAGLGEGAAPEGGSRLIGGRYPDVGSCSGRRGGRCRGRSGRRGGRGHCTVREEVAAAIVGCCAVEEEVAATVVGRYVMG
jgi:hypothetical protein